MGILTVKCLNYRWCRSRVSRAFAKVSGGLCGKCVDGYKRGDTYAG